MMPKAIEMKLRIGSAPVETHQLHQPATAVAQIQSKMIHSWREALRFKLVVLKPVDVPERGTLSSCRKSVASVPRTTASTTPFPFVLRVHGASLETWKSTNA